MVFKYNTRLCEIITAIKYSSFEFKKYRDRVIHQILPPLLHDLRGYVVDKVTVLLEAFAVLGVVVDKVGVQPRRSGK